MGADYLEEGYDSVAAELARLPPGFDAGVLDAIVDRRSWVLEVRVKTEGWTLDSNAHSAGRSRALQAAACQCALER